MASLPPVRRGGPSHTTPSASVKRASQSPSHIQAPDQVLRRYLLWHEAEGHSRKTESNYQKVLRLFFAYLRDEHQLEDLNELQVEHVRAWLVYLRNMPGQHDRPRSSKTIENYCRHLLGFLHWCVSEGVLDHDPSERVHLPKVEKKHLRVFSDEEIKRLHEACVPNSIGLRPDVRRMLTARNRAIVDAARYRHARERALRDPLQRLRLKAWHSLYHGQGRQGAQAAAGSARLSFPQ